MQTRGKISSRAVTIGLSAALVVAAALAPAIAHHGLIRSAEIKNRGIMGRDLGTSSVTARAIRTGAVGASELRDGAVDSGALRSGSVESKDIQDGTIGVDDLAQGLLAGTSRITTQQMGPWTAPDSSCGGDTGSQEFVNGTSQTPPLGTGSRRFQTGADGASYETFANGDVEGTKVAALAMLRYSTMVEAPHGTGEQAPYLVLNVDKDGDTTVDDLLFFEPVYQDGSFAPGGTPDQGDVADDTWQTWNARDGKWAVGSPTTGNPGAAGLSTLDAYVATNPDAVITRLRIAAGCGGAGWADFTGYVDNVELATDELNALYDFERA